MSGGPKGLSVFLDVNFYDNPKVIAAGEKADRLYTQALCLAKRTWSDGFISDEQVRRFGLTGVAARAAKLVEVGLFDRDDDRGGWWIHDFLDHNRSKAEQDEITEKRRKAGSKGGRPSKANGNQVANQRAEQVGKQAGNPEVKCSEEKCSDTRTPRSTQEGPSTDVGVAGENSAPIGIITRALTAMGYRDPAPPTGAEIRAVQLALDRGWTPAELVDAATDVATRSDLTSPRAWWRAKAESADPPLAADVIQLDTRRPGPLPRVHPVDCPGRCSDEGWVDLPDGQVAKCTGQPIEAQA